MIDRRDFLNGVAVSIGALSAGIGPALAADTPYPPALTGLRGSHPGSFEGAHALRDGTLSLAHAVDTGEAYDLIVVGAGMSGLAAAAFWQRERPASRVLILDNHDDFGGHAKRNEFMLGGKLHLMNGGTMLIDSPRPYSPVASGLLAELGVDPVALTKACVRTDVYPGLRRGVFFDSATFGTDRLVAEVPGEGGDAAAWAAFLAQTPLSPAVQRDIIRIETGTTDYLPGLSERAKADRLSRISYAAYLTDIVRADPRVIPYYQAATHGEWAMGIDAVSALDCWGFGLRGFAGLGLVKRAHPRMSFTPAGYVEGGSATFHFPDGNASLARLLVRRLIPGAFPVGDAQSIITARGDYAALDRPGQPVRLRLSSIAVNAVEKNGRVTVTYVCGGRLFRANAGAAVMAGYNMMIPYVVPGLPEKQAEALRRLIKAPLIYTTVALSDWRAFRETGVSSFYSPGSFWSSGRLNWPVDIGGYTAERASEKPILLFLERTPCAPGLSDFDQNRAGRAEILATPFSRFEAEILGQLTAMFPHRTPQVTAITVNRWPHGYAPEYNYLWNPDVPEAEMPHVVARQRFGRIAIANSDSGNGAYTDVAIDQGHRAVTELLAVV